MGLLSGAVAAIGNAAAAKSAANAQIKSTAATNKANKELAEQQNQWNIEQWERENAYNHPAEQAKRLKEAGLSDAAAAQAVSPNSAPHLQSTNLANQQAVGSIPYADFSPIASMNIIGIAREFEALRKEKADADITETNADYQEEVVLTGLDAQRAAAKATADANEREAQLHPYRLHQEYFKAKNEEQYSKKLKAETRLARLNVQKCKQELKYFGEKSRAEIDKILQEIDNLKKSGKNMDLQNYAQQLNNIYLETGLPRNFIGAQLAQIITGKKTVDDFNAEISRVFNLITGSVEKIGESPIFREWAKPLLENTEDAAIDIFTLIKSIGAGAVGTVRKAFGIDDGNDSDNQEQENQTPQQ